MTQRSFSPFLRLFVCLVLVFSTLALWVPLIGPEATGQGPSQRKIWLQESYSLPVARVGAVDAVDPLVSGQGQPLAMTSADVDGDGVADLVAAYRTPRGGTVVVHRGNLDAFAPQSQASFQAIAHGQFPSPFLPDARAFSVPGSPDFIAAGDFTGRGHTDLATASRGGTALYILAGDGRGNFSPGPVVRLPGGATSLAAGGFGKSGLSSTLLVGVSTPAVNGFSLLVYNGTSKGLSTVASYPLGAAVENIQIGDFGDVGPDAAFLSGNQVVLLHSSTMQLEALSLPVAASAMTLGWFVYDRNPGMQIAVLDANGSLAIAAHSEFDPRVRTADEMRAIRQAVLSGKPSPLIPRPRVATHGWKVVETIPSTAPFTPGQPPLLLRTRVSNQGAEDVMVLNASAGQMSVISHPDPVPGANTFLPASISTRPYAGAPVAAISARINVDGRPGILALHQGEISPRVMMPIPDPTFFVNRTDDPAPTSPIANACNNTSFTDTSSSCSLREAVLKANGDTIMLQAGTAYTLTRAKVANDFSGQNGALYVNNSTTIVGGSQSTTVIQAGTGNATGVDLVIAVNEDIDPITNASASISNVTIQNGHNNGVHGNDGDGGCMEFDTGSSGAATLALTNVTLNNCSTTQGNGAGIAIFNFTNPGPGGVTISNSIVQNNSASDSVTVGTGGGIWVSEGARLSMASSQVLNNQASQNTGVDGGSGGGITTTSNVSASPQVTIHGSTISGNRAAGSGGGIFAETNLLVDQASVISNNSAGSANLANQTDGGGIFADLVPPDSVTLSKVTITGNSAPNGAGGGIFNGSGSGGGAMTISFSRLAGNTAGTAGTNNLDNDDTSIIATNNWWGTNTPAGTIVSAGANGSTSFDPFIVLTHTASPNKIRINQSSTLTGDLGQDNHGSGTALAGNLDVLNGVAITFNNAVLGAIPQTQPEALDAHAQATATYNAGGVGGNGSADAVVDQQTVTASIIVLQPPSITKGFNPATVAVNNPSTLTFSISNGNTVAIDASFTDSLPTGLVVAATPNLVNGCGGTATAAAGSGSISFSNTTLAAGVCSVQVNVQSAADGLYNNSVTIDSTDAGNGNTASASLTVINPPAIAKAFAAATVPLNGITGLTFTLSSSNVNLTLNGVAFTDNLPAGLVVATPNGLSNSCGGAASAAAGGSSVSLSGASLTPGASCAVSLSVNGTTAGVKNNSVQVTSANGGAGNTANASITVVAPPSLSKSFGAASIALSGSTSLSFAVSNPNTAQSLSGVAFTDNLPSGLIVSTPNGLTGSCGGGTLTATAGSGTVSLAGGTLTAGGSCAFSLNVTGTAAGMQNNTTGTVASTEGGSGNAASASVTVVAPPAIAKAFNPTTIALNATTTLTFSLSNPAVNTVAEAGVAFADTLPAGLVVSTPSGLTNNCGGTAVATPGSAGISLSGGSIAVNASCTLTASVTGTASGQYTNVTSAVTSTNGGTGNSATANLTVASPPSISKAFGAASIPLTGITSLTFNIQNPNTLALSGVAFTDTLPAGLVVAPAPSLSNTCGGTATAAAASGSVSLSAGTLASGASCTVSVNVQGTTPGVKNNSVQVASANAGTGNTATASVTVEGPPSISKAFGAASIPLHASTSLSFSINNPNPSGALSGVGFSDALPAGLVISTPNGLAGSCGGGTITATPAAGAITLSGASLAAGASCAFSVNVTGIAPGTENNTTSVVTSNEGGNGNAAMASIAVVAPPVIEKAFNPASISPNATSILSFTIANPTANTVAQAGVAFTDNLPANIVIATPNGLTGSCGGGTITASAGSGVISLAGGSIPVAVSPGAGPCSFSINVTGSVPGSYTNTTGAVSSSNGGTGNTASATLTIAHAALSITKTHQGDFDRGQKDAQYTITVSNAANAGATTGTVTVVDNLPVIANPHNLEPVSLSGNGWNCVLTTLTCARSDALAPGASYPAITFTVNIPRNITNRFTNTATVSGGGDPNSHTGADPVKLKPPDKDDGGDDDD